MLQNGYFLAPQAIYPKCSEHFFHDAHLCRQVFVRKKRYCEHEAHMRVLKSVSMQL